AFANLRVNAVRSDHIRRANCFAGFESYFDLPIGLAEPDAPPAKTDRVGLEAMHRLGEQGVQVGAVEHDMRSTVALGRNRTELEPVPGLARAPVPKLSPRRKHLDAAERLLEAERVQNTGAVRADLDAGTHFSQLRRLLV